MKKFSKIIFIALLLTSIMCISAFAADTIVYVNGNTGNDTNTGASNSPFKTLEVALASFDGTDGGMIVVCAPLTFAAETTLSSTATGPITVTTYYRVNYANISKAQLNFEGNIYIDAPITFDKIKLNYTSDVPMVFCEGNNVTFGAEVENIYTNAAPAIYTGTYANKSGVTARNAEYADYTVSILGGTWSYVKGGTYRDNEGQIVGTTSDVTINIAGGTFTATGTSSTAVNLISPVGFDALRGDATLNISGGTFGCSIVGIGYADYNSTVSNNQYANGNVYINITGGTFSGGDIRAVQDTVSGEINGDYYLTVSGGTFTNFGTVYAQGTKGLAIADIDSTLGLTASGFDPLINLSNGGSATVTGDALIRVSGAVPSSALSISGDGKVIIEGATEDAAITIGDVLYLGTNTVIRNIALDGYGTGVVSCSDGTVLFGEGVTGNGIGLKNFTDATVRSGLFAYIKGARAKDVKLHIDGATVSGDIVAVANESSANGYVLVTSGTLSGNIYAFEYTGNEGAVHVLGGTFAGKAGVSKYPTDKCVSVFGAIVPEGATIDYTGCVKYNAPTDAIFVSGETGFAKDQTAGDGSSPLTPMTDLNEAIAASGGKQVVICGPIYLTSTTNLATVDTKTVLTSKYMGIDYRDFADARIELSEGLRASGETVIENVDFVSFERYTFVSAEGRKLTIGEGVECKLYPGKRIELYPSLVGGSHAKTLRLNYSPNLTVKSGTWGTVTGGSHYYYDTDIRTYTVGGDVNLTIAGGRFTEGVYLAGRSIVNGNMNLTVTGGTFDCSVYGSYDGKEVSGNVNITLDGGSYRGDIGRTRVENATVGQSFTLNIVGGDFDRVSQIKADGINLNVSPDINIDAAVSGSANFTNPIAGYADPSVIYHDGWYYYSFAKDYLSLPALWIAKAANIYDLNNVEPTLVWAQALSTDGADIVNLWAPQLYNFDGTWYLYTTCDIGLESGVSPRRMPIIWVAKTADPTGEYTYHGLMNNLDTDVYSYLSPRFIEFGGKRFMICGGFWRAEDKTSTTHIQRMFICEMTDPLTMATAMNLISSPKYSFEGGIMEGPFPVVSPSGTLYVLYAAGHTRTDEYCTGILKFTGTSASQLTNSSYWTKYSDPLQSANYDANVLSPGALVVTTTPSGSKYLGVYHAKEYHYSAYTMRRLYVQELTFVNDFPTMDAPQATSTVFTLEKNTIPLSDKISGNESIGTVLPKNHEPMYGETTYLSNLTLGDANFDSEINLIDALRTMKFTVGIAQADFDYVHVDMNGDNRITVLDILYILNLTFN